jgi:hypothetical protein
MLEAAGKPRGYYELVGRTRVRLAESIGDGETAKHAVDETATPSPA